jgi:hypothetical protein
MKRTLPYLMMAVGAALALFSILADALGFGKGGIQAAQIFLMEVGAAAILFGLIIITWQKNKGADNSFIWTDLRDKIDDLPSLFWVIIGILPPFIPFLVFPMFFQSDLRIHYPEGYLPKLIPIGNDLKLALDAARMWLETHQITQFVFTPTGLLFYSPMLLMDYARAYQAITLVTLSSYLILSMIAILISDRKNHSIIAFIAAISIFSYGVQFELERGQSHTITLMLCLLSVYIFHKHPRFRMFAYLLFCISVQLKFYPAIFVLLFVDDWRDWKGNLIRFGALGLANFLAFFLLGFSYFSSFYDHMLLSVQEGEASPANHSIHSFALVLQWYGMGLFDGSALDWIKNHGGMIENALYAYFLVCFSIILVRAYTKNSHEISPNLLLACVIAGLTLPSVNHDYTLPLLTIPLAIAISSWAKGNYPWSKPIAIVLLVISAFFYSLTLFPPAYKPIYFQNSLPMILVILTIATIQSLAEKAQPSSKAGVTKAEAIIK